MMAVDSALASAEAAPARRLRQAQWLALLLFVLALPLVEGPKNIAAALVLLLWLARLAVTRDAGGPWDAFDTAFAALLAAGLAAAFVGGYRDGLSDVVRIVVLAWVVKRSALGERAAVGLLLAAGAALWLALMIGLIDYGMRRSLYLELPSVGHVNQSALYLALLGATALAWTLQRAWSTPREQFAVMASAVLFILSLLITGSRAALLAFGVWLLVFGALWLRYALRSREQLRTLLVVAAVGAVLLGAFLSAARFLPADPVQVTIGAKLTDNRSMPHRMAHWRMAVEGWRERPLFGFGPDSFHTLKPEQVCTWRQARGEACTPDDYSPASHAHSLYLATAAERGGLGVVALLSFLALWAWALARALPAERTSPLWAASTVALAVVAVGGFFNTTLRVEHGSLALLMLALWLASRRNMTDKG